MRPPLRMGKRQDAAGRFSTIEKRRNGPRFAPARRERERAANGARHRVGRFREIDRERARTLVDALGHRTGLALALPDPHHVGRPGPKEDAIAPAPGLEDLAVDFEVPRPEGHQHVNHRLFDLRLDFFRAFEVLGVQLFARLHRLSVPGDQFLLLGFRRRIRGVR